MSWTNRDQVYQLKVTLTATRPPIWRRFQVAGGTSLADLHQVLQAVMGWENYHLYGFVIDGQTYSPPDDEVGDDWNKDRNTEGITQQAAAPQAGLKFTYVYDFGDEWRHQVVVERISPAGHIGGLPVCTGGKRACPPEDCGSTHEYSELVSVMRDPSHRRYVELVKWLGAPFDPEAFSLESVNEALKGLRGLS